MAITSILPQLARRLEGKVALITGGAAGIGACTARLFAQHGAHVFVADIQADKGKALCSDIGSNASTYVHCDVTHEPDVIRAVDAATELGNGRLDIVFANAGIVGAKPNIRILESTKEDFQNVVGVNLVGSYLSGKHAARAMIPNRAGSIIIMASTASVVPGTTSVSYTSSRHGNVGLMRSLAVELGQFGIRANCVSPYGLATALAEEEFKRKGEELEEFMAEHAVLKGLKLKQEDVANAVLYLASDEARYVSGVNLLIDGGFTTVNPSHGLYKYSAP